MDSATASRSRRTIALQARLASFRGDRARRGLVPARRAALVACALAGTAALLFAAALLSAHRAEMDELRAIARQASGGATDRQALFVNVTHYVHAHNRDRMSDRSIDRQAWVRQPHGLLGAIVSASPAIDRFVRSFQEPAYETFLKPSAVQVFVQGSDCAGASRLMILLLHQLGVNAFKLGIHDAAGTARHAVVSGNVNGRWVVADPLHGYVYPLEDGRLATAEDIARRPALATRFLLPNENPIIADYRHVRTINWGKIPVIMPLAYRALHAAIGDRADRIGRPLVVEMPKVLSAILFAAIGLALLLPALALGLPGPALRGWVQRPVQVLLGWRLVRAEARRKV